MRTSHTHGLGRGWLDDVLLPDFHRPYMLRADELLQRLYSRVLLRVMDDTELAEYLGIAGTKECARIMASITPDQRAMYEHMNKVEWELRLWLAGAGPKPEGVIVCREKPV